MANKIERIKELTNQLHEASVAYYKYDKPVMSDKHYDELYDELEKLENETGVILADSPTHHVQGYVLDGLKKVQHSKPMLSADKTKDPEEIKKFLKNYDWYCSYKLDGLTLVVRYNENGEFVQGITRGTGGIVGEDVTEQCRFIKNLPMKIPCYHGLELRGECVVSYDEFDRVNKEVAEPFSHPRGLAGGTLRTLDLNVVKDRKLSFVVFELVSPTFTHKLQGLDALDKLGFETVQRSVPKNKEKGVEDCIEAMQPEFCKYPVDGLIFELNSSELSKSLGSTSHHDNCRMALKWEDETYPTTLKYVDWTMGKTGSLTPTAVFEAVEIDGSVVERASLHNVSVMKSLGIKACGQTVHVYKSNMIIPQIDRAEDTDKQDNLIPSICPYCGAQTHIEKNDDTEVLYCSNSYCPGKMLGLLSNFVSKRGVDIPGLSEATLQFLMNKGWVRNFNDIYHLRNNDIYKEWINSEGFGKRSVDKILNAIDSSRTTTLDKLLTAISIPNIGSSASKDIAKACDYDFEKFCSIMTGVGSRYFKNIDGFGDVMISSMNGWKSDSWIEFLSLAQEFTFDNPDTPSETSEAVKGLSFVITGKLSEFVNRDAAKAKIEACGGKVAGSVTSKTSYLVNNDIESTSSKNKKAKELGIPIITERQLIEMLEH